MSVTQSLPLGATVSALDFAPLLPWSVIGGLAGIALLAIAIGGLQKMSGWIWRSLGVLMIALVLANPSLVEEERDPLPDVAVLVTDTSASMTVGGRREASEEMAEALRREAETDPMLDLIEVEAGETADGTMLFDGVNAALASAPPDRLAGVVLVTDGQTHDPPLAPDAPNAAPPIPPVTTGARSAGGRRRVIHEAPPHRLPGQTRPARHPSQHRACPKPRRPDPGMRRRA